MIEPCPLSAARSSRNWLIMLNDPKMSQPSASGPRFCPSSVRSPRASGNGRPGRRRARGPGGSRRGRPNREAGLREAQTRVQATGERGVILQLIERDIAVDEGDDAKVARLDTLMREAVDRLAVDALMPEAA
jgi:hypothetical protein